MKLSDLDLHKIGNEIGLVGAVFDDEFRTYLCLFPGQRVPPPGTLEVLDMNLEEWKKFLRQVDLQEVEVLQKTQHGDMAKTVLRKSQRLIEQRVSWAVFERDGYRCVYCGAKGIPLTVDHLILWEEGGPSIEENLVSACRKCNKTRGCTKYEDWLQSKYYLEVSKRLPMERLIANERLTVTIKAVEKRHSERATRK